MSAFPEFSLFFRELWDREPFPWQSMLAERVTEGSWPQALDLPTAAGKTACIDIAIYALAAQSRTPLMARTATRRIWFVVDRRIVVDEAYARAEQIAKALAEAREGPLREVAERLRGIAGTMRPLATARLRGGVFRDDGWARLPSQPAVITSTVDQVGSRLLFRGYGWSQLAAPIFAGLAANDSLVLLDEAHCSVPFLQTLRAIETYRGPKWAEVHVPTPFAVAILSATPPADIPDHAVFPGPARAAALDHAVLRQRLGTSKLAELVELKVKGNSAEDSFLIEAVRRASSFLANAKTRVAVIVNRVRTAEAIMSALEEKVGDEADVVLLTGRMRSFERDALVDRWKKYLRAASPDDPSRPIVTVSTQCLEVGADFSFDALVTEAASLDALRQRFGRLHRMGKPLQADALQGEQLPDAAILIRDLHADPENAEPDPIYGSALARTWKLLNDHAADHIVDFGVDALRERLSDVDDLTLYVAPTTDAPILLPAHVDLLCQTAPRPAPEPDVSLFLHGRERGAPEVRVIWRADLAFDKEDTWLETIALCPPVSAEMLSVPLYRLRAVLGKSASADESADIEGVAVDGQEEAGHGFRPCVVWRGRDRSKLANDADDIAPGDIVVLAAEVCGIEGLGQSAAVETLGTDRLDLWEPALRSAGRPPAVRLNRAALAPWLGCSALSNLLAVAETPDRDREALDDAIEAVLDYGPENEDAPAAPPAWWLDMLRKVSEHSGRVEEHPGGGVVLFAPASLARFRSAEPDLFADDDDLTSVCGKEVSLDEHSELVKRTVEKLAKLCLPEDYLPIMSLSAYWHDVGKLDERFQILLRQGNELLATLSGEKPLAKSASIPVSPARRRFIREASRLPENFRHEMLSAELAERHAPKPEDRTTGDLFLHLIASHHGHARPFAPVSPDSQPPTVAGRLGLVSIALSSAERVALVPAHGADSGIADRFWRLTRRYGWWGLSYLEALLRLGDWYASGLTLGDKPETQQDE